MDWKLTSKQVAALQKVKKHVLRVPARLAMRAWLVQGSLDLAESLLAKPSCGTVGCIGGWLEELNRRDYPTSTRDAYEILGVRYGEHFSWSSFFDRSRHKSVYDFFHDNLLMGQTPQTKEHAEAVAAHIDRFIEEHS